MLFYIAISKRLGTKNIKIMILNNEKVQTLKKLYENIKRMKRHTASNLIGEDTYSEFR